MISKKPALMEGGFFVSGRKVESPFRGGSVLQWLSQPAGEILDELPCDAA